MMRMHWRMKPDAHSTSCSQRRRTGLFERNAASSKLKRWEEGSSSEETRVRILWTEDEMRERKERTWWVGKRRRGKVMAANVLAEEKEEKAVWPAGWALSMWMDEL